MHWRSYIVVVCLAAMAVCACGGSGSSGFDIAAENSHINTALTEQSCTVEDGFTICPADTPPLSLPANPDPTPPIPGLVQLGIDRSEVDITSCHDQAEPCRFDVRLQASGFPLDTVYQLAQRPADDVESGWTLSRATRAGGDGSVRFEIEANPADLPLQLAVLVHLGGNGTAPGHIKVLQEAGADLVFVSH